MILITHKRLQTRPLYIAEDSRANEILDLVLKEHPKILRDDMVISSDSGPCKMDPGGMLFGRIPFSVIDIDGVKFSVQPHKIEQVLDSFDPQPLIPGFQCIFIWNYVIVVSSLIFEKLKNELQKMRNSEDVLHAQLDVQAAKDDLEENKCCLFGDTPRETYNT